MRGGKRKHAFCPILGRRGEKTQSYLSLYLLRKGKKRGLETLLLSINREREGGQA